MRPTDKMPTMGRLVAALLLAGLAYYASGMVIANWPYEQDFGLFRYVSTLVAIAMGWKVVGSRLGRGAMQGVSAGLTGLFALLFWVFLLLSFYEMIDRSMDLRYKGPFEALNGMFEIAYEYLLNSAHLELGVVLLVGAMATGLIAELVARKFS